MPPLLYNILMCVTERERKRERERERERDSERERKNDGVKIIAKTC